MSLKIKSNLVSLFKSLEEELESFADSQNVHLFFESITQNLQVMDRLERRFSEITVLVQKIIAYTPHSHSVRIYSNQYNWKMNRCVLIIENTGMDLSKVGDILSVIKKDLNVVRLQHGTRFIISIPIKSNSSNHYIPGSKDNLLPRQYPMYFSSVQKRLSNHFSNFKNMEEATYLNLERENIFLKKVNTIIHMNMSDSEFKVDSLAAEMALSRTQLFRKIKNLTKKSPQQYLRFVRLEKAKKLLEVKGKGMNVSEVCYKVGFVSPSHFTRSFQNEFGFNPSDCVETKM